MNFKKKHFGGEKHPKQGSRQDESQPNSRFIFGINPVIEALRARPSEIDHIYMVQGQLASEVAAELLSRARAAGVRVTKVPRERLTFLAEGGVHQGVVAKMREYDYLELEELILLAQKRSEPPLLVILDGIQDPHNFGAIVRSAHALGAHGIVIPKDRAVGVTGTVAKASAGAIEHCKVSRVTNISRALEELKEAGFWIVAADPKGQKPLWATSLGGPLGILVGAEGDGIRDGVMKHVDFRCSIPMSGRLDSLNASVSAGVLLYEVSRQRAQSDQTK